MAAQAMKTKPYFEQQTAEVQEASPAATCWQAGQDPLPVPSPAL